MVIKGIKRGEGGGFKKYIAGKTETAPRNKEEVKKIMKGKLKSATTTWKTTLRSQKEVREKLEEDFGGKKTRRCKNAMKILNKAERNSRAYSKQKYSEKFKTLERKYNKTEKEKEDPILACYPGVSYTDLDLSRGVIVPRDKNVACKSCTKS